MTLRNKRTASWIATAGLATLFATGSALAANTAREAVEHLQSHGYTATYDLKLQNGIWSAKTTTQDGQRVHVLLDPNNQLVEVGNPATHDAVATAAQVVSHLQSLGYTRIRDVALDDGFWEAEARNAAGLEVDLLLHPVTLAVVSEVVDGLGSAQPGVGNDFLSANDVRSRLQQAGYTNIRDLEMDDGHWEADARNPAGRKVELRIDPRTGAVVREKND